MYDDDYTSAFGRCGTGHVLSPILCKLQRPRYCGYVAAHSLAEGSSTLGPQGVAVGLHGVVDLHGVMDFWLVEPPRLSHTSWPAR